MNELSVILAFGLPDELVTPIRDVSPRLRVVRLSGGERRAYRSGRTIWYAYAEQRRPEKETDQEAEAGLARILTDAEVLFTSPLMPANITDRAPKLRWVQLTSAGVDRLLDGDLAKSGVTITTASGIHAVPIGEYVMGVMLAFAKGLPQAMRAQAERTWRPYLAEELYDKTVGIVGLGAIGGYVAKLAKADGMRVLALRRSTRSRSTGEAAGLDDVDELLPLSDLPYLLSEADYVVIAVPLTAESRGLIGERELRAMKPTARIINIARGAIIDEAALVQALNEKWIGGAALDVFDHEPLPPESELWGMENVILTPHISGGTPVYMERAVELFCDNLRCYLAGEPLRNVVEVERGY
ncbi:MAG: D-2-hydroxyacid dehydrogenase [Chloroflexi bacterium]|nr:D-2-hydroxyacid dehydrogenase [Chloroflexota bacterium]